MAKNSFRYYDLLLGAFVSAVLCSNLIGSAKIAVIGGISFGAGVVFFPLSYFLNNVLSEVYGFAHARRVLWAGLLAMVFASVMSWIVIQIPPSGGWPYQGAFETIFGATPRILIASWIAFFAGGFLNIWIFVRMKAVGGGKHLWLRAVVSTVAGEALDSVLFYPIAFWGDWEPQLIFQVMSTDYAFKVGWEIAALPFLYLLTKFLKRAEASDPLEHSLRFQPFRLSL